MLRHHPQQIFHDLIMKSTGVGTDGEHPAAGKEHDRARVLAQRRCQRFLVRFDVGADLALIVLGRIDRGDDRYRAEAAANVGDEAWK